ncbi:hypothetical protein NW762_012103 [Fusarium torreyae]|uniref:2EXR domain-containing protein n=1 Tax=Fusarium torreyae TaxID=1237075 RepID=A0A9W8RRN0_9HYPO|nr:hypothetical protein NW762_012103 [Fusarium torreyae]
MASTSNRQCQLTDQTIYNSTPRKTDEVFSSFSLLPLDIRWIIWEQSLSHERLLHVKLYDSFSIFGSKAPPIGDIKYTLVLLGRCPISKLFRINRETRHIARCFYRVQIPCVYRWQSVEVDGIFYFNPELDILKLNSHCELSDRARGLKVASEYFAEFAHRIWLNDRRQVGIINLGLESFYPQTDYFELCLAKGSTIDLLRDVLRRLECVYFISCVCFSPTWFSTLSEYMALKRTYPRIQPVMIYASAFERIPQDPRSTDLRTVYVGKANPRKQVVAWRTMLSRLQVRGKIGYRYMLARRVTAMTENHDLNTALAWVKKSDRKRKARMLNRRRPDDELFRRMQQESQIAFGFWLFPIECLEQDLDIDMDPAHPQRYWEVDRVLNLSSFTPELCVFRL